MKNQIARALVERIVRAAQADQKFQVGASSAPLVLLSSSIVLDTPLILHLILYSILTPCLQVIVTIPEVPGFSGNIKDEGSLKIIMAAQYRTINRGGRSIYEEIRKAGFEP